LSNDAQSLNRLISNDMETRVQHYEAIYLFAIVSMLIWHAATSMHVAIVNSQITLAINFVTMSSAFLISRFKKINYKQASNLFTVCLTIFSLTLIYNTHRNNYHQVAIFACLITLCTGASMLASRMRVIIYAYSMSAVVATGSFVFADNFINVLFFGVTCILIVPAMTLHHSIYERLARRNARLDTIYNNAAAGIVQVDNSGKILQSNRKFLEMSEYNEHDLKALTLPQICHEADVVPLTTFLHNAKFEYSPHAEIRIQSKFGKFIWVRLVSSHNSKNSANESLIIIALDISQEKKINELSNFQKQILTMFARKVGFKTVIAEIAKFLSIQSGGLPVAISIVKNNSFEIAGSFNLPDNIADSIRQRPVEPGYGNCYEAFKTKVIQIGEVVKDHPSWRELQAVNPTNPLAACWSAPFLNDSGNAAGVIEVFKYTEGIPNSNLLQAIEIFCSLAGLAVMVNNSDELQKTYMANLTQTAKLASLGEMAAGIAHEINNPMTIIQGRAEQIKGVLLVEPIDAMKIDKIADNIMASVQRVAKIIKGLRAFARFNADMDFTPVKLTEVLNETIDLCKERFKVNNVTLRINISDHNIVVISRGTQLSQVLLNLLNNAYDAIDGRSDKWIEVDAQETEEFVKLTVTDSGAGIPNSIAEKLFQPFFTTKGVDKGTGLGLSMSHGIIADHGGRIYVDNKSRHTKFVIEMPKHSEPALDKIA
jgi:PAS domain S-box-containing protein